MTPRVKNLLYILVIVGIASGAAYVVLDQTNTFRQEEDVKSSEDNAAKHQSIKIDEQYYAELEKQCAGRPEEKACCQNAVGIMKQNGYQKAEGGKCPAGMETDGLDCIGNIPWCKPLPQGEKTGWNSYTSPTQYGFSIQYPNDFGFNTDINKIRALAYVPVCDESMAACVFYAGDKYKDTNFEGAGVSINILKDLNTESKCYNFNVSTNEAQKDAGIVSINGVDFHSAAGGGGGMGHFGKVQVYRNFHNGSCYEVARHLSSTNIGVYEPGTVKEFNENEVWSGLGQVLSTFKFVDTDSVKPGNQVTITGKIECLPHKGVKPGQPETLECAIGLHETGSGKYYGLLNFPMRLYGTQDEIRVSGKLVTNPSSLDRYDVAGSIEVEKVD